MNELDRLMLNDDDRVPPHDALSRMNVDVDCR